MNLSMFLPGLAPDLAWCLGMEVPESARRRPGPLKVEKAGQPSGISPKQPIKDPKGRARDGSKA